MQQQLSGAVQGTWLHSLGCALSWPVAKRSLLITLIVGSILNVINQGDVLWTGENVVWWKLAMTYCVPFCVATYGACSAFRAIGGK